MDRIDAEQRAAIKKTSSERLVAYLTRINEDLETVLAMDRTQLMEAWATAILEGRDKPTEPKLESSPEYDIQMKRLEFERHRYEQDRKLAEKEREERQKREEDERQERKLELELRRLEIEDRRKKDDEDRAIRLRELKLREDEIERQRLKDREEGDRRKSLVSRTKLFMEAMKGVMWQFPTDPVDIPGYFEHLENLFELYGVDEVVKSKLLQCQLNERAKSLVVRLTREELDDYKSLKDFLLNEFKISPLQLRDRFYSLRKADDETYTLLASKLYNALIYYLKSRQVVNYEQLVSLLCADRLKEILPKSCLDFVLTQEKGTWLKHDELANTVDVYMASHDTTGFPLRAATEPFNSQQASYLVRTDPVPSNSATQLPKAGKPTKEEIMKKGLCFHCLERGHVSRLCPKRTAHQSSGAKVNRCYALNNTGLVAPSEPMVKVEPYDCDISLKCPIAKSDTDHSRLDSRNTHPQHYIDAEEFHERPYVDVHIENLPVQSALIDSGSNICCIRAELVSDKNIPIIHQISLSGIGGESRCVNVTRLGVKPISENSHVVNIAPLIRAWFAIVPNLSENVILTPNVADLLQDIQCYDVFNPNVTDVNNSSTQLSRSSDITQDDEQWCCLANTIIDNELTTLDESNSSNVKGFDIGNDVFDTENPNYSERSADAGRLSQEQHSCPSLSQYWKLANQNRTGFFTEGGLLYHRDTIMGHKVKQLCLPEVRVPVVLEMAHDAPVAGHMAYKSTSHRIKLNFWFPKMNDRIREYCTSCKICQLRAPNKIANRVPITPIPRDDELPFTHLVMDCIGPIIPEGDTCSVKPEYNHALVIICRYSRWPMAYPLKSMTAKAVCDALLQVFMTFSIPKVVTSDCGTNFTSKLTCEFLKRLGCCPRFNTPGHPEASGIVERLNQSLKRMIYKLCQSNPKGWHKLLPFVLWSLRERPSDTTHISPYTLVYGTLPRGPLCVLKESWEGDRELPLNLGKKPEEYLQSLKENLEMAKEYANYYADIESKRYAAHYNLRSTERHYEVGDKVAVLSPDSNGAKLYSRWQGPGTIIQVKSPYSYIVELDGKPRHVHANKIKKFIVRIEKAVVQSCTVIFERDEDFGPIEIIEEQPVTLDLPSKRIDSTKISHLEESQRGELLALLDEYPDVFSDKPGFCPLIEHSIQVNAEFKPKRLRAYKVPEVLKPEVDRQIKEMIEQGIIVPSNSEMASPIVCVLKGPNGQNGVRIAVDYRHVNHYSAGDCFPTPDIPDVLHKVGKANYISCFDAKSGYWQIPMQKDSQWLTAFVCDAGVFEFRRMPFGLKSAGNTFMRCIAQILAPVRTFTEPFVDDMSVYSMTWKEHLQHLRCFLDTIRASGLTLSLKKCNFARNKVRFVGHIIGSGRIEPDPSKVATIDDIKPPTTKKEVRRLVGFFNYFRSFLPMLSEKIRMITDLTRNDVPNKVPWLPTHQEALEQLKIDLCRATALHTIDFSKEFGLLVDASASSVGCCLIQWTDEGVEKPIAFASMKLSPAQSHWSTIEREAYAVIWALKKYQPWILLSKVIIFSDHNPLLYLTESAPKSAKLTRWALALQDFNIDFRYKTGRSNVVADFLSRFRA